MRLSYKDCGKIGFTCSTFDLLHAGHITMLEEAKHHCDYLIVGVQSDSSIDRPEKNSPARGPKRLRSDKKQTGAPHSGRSQRSTVVICARLTEHPCQ